MKSATEPALRSVNAESFVLRARVDDAVSHAAQMAAADAMANMRAGAAKRAGMGSGARAVAMGMRRANASGQARAPVPHRKTNGAIAAMAIVIAMSDVASTPRRASRNSSTF